MAMAAVLVMLAVGMIYATSSTAQAHDVRCVVTNIWGDSYGGGAGFGNTHSQNGKICYNSYRFTCKNAWTNPTYFTTVIGSGSTYSNGYGGQQWWGSQKDCPWYTPYRGGPIYTYVDHPSGCQLC